MKKIYACIISILLFSTVFAQNKSEADAVFEKITKEYTLNEDGSIDYHYFKQLRLNSYFSFNRLYGETFIVYNPEYQNLQINEAYTVMADGRKIKTPDNAFNEVLPRSAAHSANFNGLREMVVTHTALERGATIFLDYTIHSDEGFMPALMGNELIEESSPVREMEIIVRLPAEKELKHAMFRMRTAPEIVVQGRNKIYTWKFSGIAAAPKEYFRGHFLPESPRLLFTTAKDSEGLITRICQQKAFELKLNNDMQTFADTIKAQQKEEISTLMAIQDEVITNLAYDRVSMERTGFRLRTPVEVWNSNGGSQAEKAILLTALLRAAGFNATPVMAGPEQLYKLNDGNLLLFKETLVMVNTKSYGTIYLSAINSQDQSLEFAMNGQVLIPLRQNGHFATLRPGNEKNSIHFEADLEIENIDHITGTIKMALTGTTNPFLKLCQDSSSICHIISGQLCADNHDAIKINNSNVLKTELSLEVENNDSLKEHQGYYRWKLPVMQNGFENWHIRYLNTKRLDAFVLPNTLEESYQYSIEIPDGFEVITKNCNINLNCDAGSAKITFRVKGRKLDIRRELKFNSNIIKVSAYEEFRNMINQWIDKNYRMVVFKENTD